MAPSTFSTCTGLHVASSAFWSNRQKTEEMMKIGVLGTGMVGEAIASKLVALGHDVMMGSRDAKNPKATARAKRAGSRAQTGTFRRRRWLR